MSGRMNDPENQAARVFVGGVNPNTPELVLNERFSQYGNVKGVIILKGFAFVQFSSPDEAQRAIENENGAELNGKLIDVKSAKKSSIKENKNDINIIPNEDWAFQQDSDNRQGLHSIERIRDRSCDRGSKDSFNQERNPNSDWMNNDRERNSSFRGGNFRGNGGGMDDRHGRGRGGRGGDRGRGPYGHRGGGYRGNRGGLGYPGRGGGYNQNMDGPQHGGYTGQEYNAPSGPNREQPNSQETPNDSRVNDAEIVCVSRFQRGFAEIIEARMKNFGMQTDVLFPNPDIPLQKILTNIASRGVLLAIIVTPLHEEHRSMTVNILQGPQSQEHRNMPFDDAMTLVAKTFENHMANNSNPDITDGVSSIGSGNRDSTRIGSDHGNSNNSQLPNDVRNVLGFLLDQRPLSVMEYDKLIKWLAQQRHQVLQAEYGDNIPSELATPPVGPPVDPATRAQQIELQERITNILNKPKPLAAAQHNTPNQFGGMQSAAGSGGMDNPLQRAIDNLIRTGPNLLNQAAQSSSSGAGGAGNTGSNPGSGIGHNSVGDNANYSGFGVMGKY